VFFFFVESNQESPKKSLPHQGNTTVLTIFERLRSMERSNQWEGDISIARQAHTIAMQVGIL